MSRRDAVVLGSRLLAVLFSLSALTKVSYLPSAVFSYLHYGEGASFSSLPYRRHHYLLALGFIVVRIVGFSLMSMWLFRCGPDVEELLLPSSLGADERA